MAVLLYLLFSLACSIGGVTRKQLRISLCNYSVVLQGRAVRFIVILGIASQVSPKNTERDGLELG